MMSNKYMRFRAQVRGLAAICTLPGSAHTLAQSTAAVQPASMLYPEWESTATANRTQIENAKQTYFRL